MDNRVMLIVKAVTSCANIAGKTIDEFGMELFVESLHSLADEKFERAMSYFRQCFKEQRLPKIVEIEAFADGRLSNEETAIHVADLIGSAIVKFGEPNDKQAREFVGELGWKVIEQVGGWSSVCAIESFRDLEIAKVHWRQTAAGVQKMALGGFLDDKPKLPAPIIRQIHEALKKQIPSNK